jgi:hypothetical protein
MTDDHDRPAGQPGWSPDEGRIVREEAVAVQLDVLLEDRADVVQRVWPLRVAGELNSLPGRQAGGRARAISRREPGMSVGQGVHVGEALLGAGQGQAPFPLMAEGRSV